MRFTLMHGILSMLRFPTGPFSVKKDWAKRGAVDVSPHVFLFIRYWALRLYKVKTRSFMVRMPDRVLHAFTGFAKASLDFGSDHTLLFGGSVTGGKTKTDTVAPEPNSAALPPSMDAELTYKWKPSNQKSLIVQTEYLFRHQAGDLLNFPHWPLIH